MNGWCVAWSSLAGANFTEGNDAMLTFAPAGGPHCIITIKDLTGKTILTRLIRSDNFNNEIINIFDAHNGVYRYECIGQDGMTTCGRLVVAK